MLDLRSLAAFRVGIGLILLYDLASRALDLSAHYTDAGALPRHRIPPGADFGGALLPLHELSGSAVWEAALFVLAAALAALVLIGLRARLALLGSWLLLGSLQARNPLICYEADIFLGLLLVSAMLLPVDQRFAWDARRPPASSGHVSLAGAGLVLQVGFVYFFAALSKSGPTWQDGSAVTLALAIDQYTTPLGKLVGSSPALCRLLTWGALASEYLAPILLCSPFASARLRCLGLALIASLQLGFFSTMDLGIFPAVSLLALVPLVPGAVWDRLRGLPPGGEGDPEPPPSAQASAWTWRSNVALLLLLTALAWNVVRLNEWVPRVPASVEETLRRARLDQSWSMFAPDPMVDDGWFVLSTRLEDESLVDLLNDGAPLSWEKPASVSRSFPGDRWKELFMTAQDQTGLWAPIAAWWAKDWNHRHPENPVVSVSVVHVLETTLEDGREAPAEREYLWTGRP